MSFLRRNQATIFNWKSAPCTPKDPIEWWKTLAQRAPRDGRYYVAWFVIRNDQWCSLQEHPATRSEVQKALADFAQDYRSKPRRLNEFNVGDIDGVWATRRKGFPDAQLVIVHSDFIELVADRVDI